jgi:hypothetical protein
MTDEDRAMLRKMIEGIFYVAPELLDSAISEVLDEIDNLVREAKLLGYDDGVRDAGERL